jgi:hypothetical protein
LLVEEVEDAGAAYRGATARVSPRYSATASNAAMMARARLLDGASDTEQVPRLLHEVCRLGEDLCRD